MPSCFNSFNWFTVSFIAVLFFDIILSNIEGMLYYSLIPKFVLLVILVIFFLCNSQLLGRFERGFVLLALVSFSIGEVLMMLTNNIDIIGAGFLFLLAAKLLYSCAFVYRVNIDIDRLLPYLVFVMLYSLTVIYFLYDVPEHIPAYIFLVITLIMLKLAYMRFEKVGWNSFLLVLAGAALVLTSETILVFDRPFNSAQLNGFLIVLFYGLSQFLFVSGLVLQPQSRLVNKMA